MKRTILLFLVSLVSIAAHGQGSVTFQNASTISGWNPVADRNVKFGAVGSMFNPLLNAGANVSSNYAGVNLSSLRAALFYSPGVVSDANWYTLTSLAMPVSGSPYATFKNSTSSTAGSWFGGTRTMAGIPEQGGVASLMVFVWDSSLTANPVSREALSGLSGRSSVFQYTTPASVTPAPAEFLPNNLMSFGLGSFLDEGLPPDAWGGVPEPTTTALTGLGAALLCLLRSRKND